MAKVLPTGLDTGLRGATTTVELAAAEAFVRGLAPGLVGGAGRANVASDAGKSSEAAEAAPDALKVWSRSPAAGLSPNSPGWSLETTNDLQLGCIGES